MKIFYSESLPDYSTYTFNYGIYCRKDDNSELTEIYNAGFLPYSANPQLTHEVFYMARSLRVDLDRFSDSGENRRVNRKIEALEIEMNCIDKKILLAEDDEMITFCENYASSRIGNAMSPERLRYIFSLDTGTHVFRFTQGDDPIGYVLASCNGEMVHYWFSFFDIELMRSHSLGKWMMWSIIKWAQEQGAKNVYLGTVYGSKSLYKVRDHNGLSFFDGCRWNQNTSLLKTWCKADADQGPADRFKMTGDPNEYLNRLG